MGVTAASPIPWREARVEVDQPAKVVAELLPRLCSSVLCVVSEHMRPRNLDGDDEPAERVR